MVGQRKRPIDMLPEHRDNPFVVGLGPPPNGDDVIAMLSVMPEYNPAERAYAPHLRRYCVLRLLEFRRPLVRQIDLVERIGMVIRQGYKGRNPNEGKHHRAVLNAAAGAVSRGQLATKASVETSSCGFAVLGYPGMGKTLTVNRALGYIPEVLTPKLSYSVTQIPWLKVECPAQGSPRQFCLAFLAALDDRLGGGEHKLKYGTNRRSAEELMLEVQRLASVYALGLLVIDEIQHLNESKLGTKPLMNFLVTLINRIGVPVVLVGTMSASTIIQEDFREARRASGVGSPIWNRLQKDEEWDDFIENMWMYQWTAVQTVLTEEIKDVLYYESQGIIDIVIKLFMLTQFRAIIIGEVGKGDETLTPALFTKVAADELKVIQPMMTALRDGREGILNTYPDLQSLNVHVEGVLSAALGTTPKQIRERLLTRQAVVDMPPERSMQINLADKADFVRADLLGRGLAEDIVGEIIAEIRRRVPSGDLFKMLDVARELIEAPVSALKKTRPPKLNKAPLVAGDLRTNQAADKISPFGRIIT